MEIMIKLFSNKLMSMLHSNDVNIYAFIDKTSQATLKYSPIWDWQVIHKVIQNVIKWMEMCTLCKNALFPNLGYLCRRKANLKDNVLLCIHASHDLNRCTCTVYAVCNRCALNKHASQ